jgi:hypothetical protein
VLVPSSQVPCNGVPGAMPAVASSHVALTGWPAASTNLTGMTRPRVRPPITTPSNREWPSYAQTALPSIVTRSGVTVMVPTRIFFMIWRARCALMATIYEPGVTRLAQHSKFVQDVIFRVVGILDDDNRLVGRDLRFHA